MQIRSWDENARLEKLSRLGDSLKQLNQTINWDVFHPRLVKVFRKDPKGAGGRPPYDYLMLFKILVLQMGDDMGCFELLIEDCKQVFYDI